MTFNACMTSRLTRKPLSGSVQVLRMSDMLIGYLKLGIAEHCLNVSSRRMERPEFSYIKQLLTHFGNTYF